MKKLDNEDQHDLAVYRHYMKQLEQLKSELKADPKNDKLINHAIRTTVKVPLCLMGGIDDYCLMKDCGLHYYFEAMGVYQDMADDEDGEDRAIDLQHAKSFDSVQYDFCTDPGEDLLYPEPATAKDAVKIIDYAIENTPKSMKDIHTLDKELEAC